ncbi:hypothetical protein F5882DRAFT_397067 [Hyaloscypha sp. PMI_1271]|nr:hypothetical protein F5882DRAFT_397067 [Hyaloscypha sp. PMI_1271]
MARQKSVGSQELADLHCFILFALLSLSSAIERVFPSRRRVSALCCALLLFALRGTTTTIVTAPQAPDGQRHTFDELLCHNSFAFLNAKFDIRVSHSRSLQH